MPEVRLEDYLEQVAGLIDAGQPGDAVRHCRNILEQFPRHVHTYRLLGKALLELRQYDDAGDIFQRILSTDPRDFIAHAGMAILHQEQDRLDEAIWHMERAFEADPYNRAIRDTLNDLYGRRDGAPAERLMLTRGALARIYVEGSLYSLAIAELQELLAGDAGRTDLQVLLAEALWRDGQRVDAVDVCVRILERLPDCVVANAILAEVWFLAGRTDEAQDHLRRIYRMALPTAERLQGDDPLASAFRVNEAFSLPAEITVKPLPEIAAAGPLDEMSEWLKGVDPEEGIDLEDADPEWLEALQGDEEALSGVEDDAVADWLRQVAAQVPPERSPSQKAPEAPEAAVDLPAEGEDETAAPPPGPVREGEEEDLFAWSEESDTSDETAPEGAAEWPDHPSDQLPGIGELSEETDWEDWLEHEREAGAPETPAESRPDSPVFEEVGMGANDERDGFQEQFPEDQDSGAPEKEHHDQSSVDPDWLEEFEAASSEVPQSGDRPADDDESLPDWLKEDAGILEETGDALTWLDDGQAVQDAGDEGETPDKELPDWLEGEVADSIDEPEGEVEDELSWLDQIAAGEGAPIEEPPTMSWPESEEESAGADFASPADEPLHEAREASHIDQEAGETISESGEQLQEWDDDEIPGEVDDTGPSPDVSIDEVPEDLDDAMEWMEQLAAQEGEPFPDMPPIDELSEVDEETLLQEMPDDLDEAMTWLSDLAEEEPAEETTLPVGDETVEGEEAADWLSAFVDEEEEEPGPAEEGFAFGSEDVEQSDEEEFVAEEGALDQLETDVGAEVGDDEFLIGVEEARLEELGRDVSEEYVSDEDVSDEEVPEDLDDAMAWLEQLAAKQGASLDELPSLRQMDAESAADEPLTEGEAEQPGEDELDWIDAMGEEGEAEEGWLDEVAESPAAELEDVAEWSEPEEPAIDEPPTEGELEEPVEDELDWMDAIGEEGELEEEWLDEVSDDQAQPVASEEEEVGELPGLEEPGPGVDEAMRWLDELAESPTAPRSELSALEESLESEEWPEQDLEDLDEIPEDPDAALAWLESLARGEVTADQDADSVEEQQTPPVPQDVVEARAEAEAIILRDQGERGLDEDEEILSEMPDDPDEAMDWLERLAARQGASLDELPSVDTVEDDVETPPWISQEVEQETGEAPEARVPADEMEISDVPEELTEEIESEADADEDRAPTAEVEEITDVPEAEGLSDEEEFLADLDLGDDDLDEALPKWLDIEDEADLDEFDWDEVSGDVTGWLEAEDEATQHDMEVPDTGQLPVDASDEPDLVMDHEQEVEALSEPQEVESASREEEPAPFEPEVQPAPVSAGEDLDDEKLQAARQAMDAGDSQSALTAYRDLLETGQNLSLLIGELEVASEEHPDQPQLLRLLGDAYMENGQLQRALDAYRSALDTI